MLAFKFTLWLGFLRKRLAKAAFRSHRNYQKTDRFSNMENSDVFPRRRNLANLKNNHSAGFFNVENTLQWFIPWLKKVAEFHSQENHDRTSKICRHDAQTIRQYTPVVGSLARQDNSNFKVWNSEMGGLLVSVGFCADFSKTVLQWRWK